MYNKRFFFLNFIGFYFSRNIYQIITSLHKSQQMYKDKSVVRKNLSWLPLRVVGLVVMGSFLKVQEVEILDSNSAMGSAYEKTQFSRLMLTSIFNRAGCTTMAHLNPLLLQAQPSRQDVTMTVPRWKTSTKVVPYPIFVHKKKKKNSSWLFNLICDKFIIILFLLNLH